MPILFQSVDTDLVGRGDIWVEDLGSEPVEPKPHVLAWGGNGSDGHSGGAAGNSLVKLNLTLK